MKIKATLLYDGLTSSENSFITIENDRIVSVSSEPCEVDFEGVVTPAFIDPHSHIGMERQGEPGEEGETNDEIDQITPLNNPLNSIYFDDRAFADAVDFGVLYSCVVPGSGNLLGGKAMIIKNFARTRGEALIKHYGYKMALGFNPRSTGNWKGTRPTTRMGVYAHLETTFDDVLQKREKERCSLEDSLSDIEERFNDDKIDNETRLERIEIVHLEHELEFSPTEKALLEILDGKKICKVHVHKEDDILYLLELAEKYELKITIEHACDVFNQEIFDIIAQKNIPIVYGPLGSFDYKVELKHAYYQNPALLMRSKAEYALMTDHPVVLTHSLRDSLKYFLIQGMQPAEAISLITSRSAKILGLEKDLGTVEAGKLASIIVWDQDPFHLGAFPRAVIAEGKVVRDFMVSR
ncbi:MAG: amidohydrolase family protein [Spirochaetes bacterium]|jgi:imidazolonepropionase-like amidohydrolase|nr:amidohydrolase family protein [Spirochaetota bacterium]